MTATSTRFKKKKILIKKFTEVHCAHDFGFFLFSSFFFEKKKIKQETYVNGMVLPESVCFYLLLGVNTQGKTLIS